ncbi:MAG TPA: apolipoprotein N-acyltransferase [Vicinamibacterales bacterium]|nr:apolipoprotein N-acyltransferase [Vicinamibacterales bacterium]
MLLSLDVLFALVSGVCLTLSFPRFGHPAFGWIALVPLLAALTGWRGRAGHFPGCSSRRAFALGLLAGLVYFVGTVYWTGAVVETFGGLSGPVALFAMGLLALYLALYPALAALAIGRLVRAGGVRALFLFPAAWAATEYLRGGYLMGGFPWVPLGNSQVTVLPVAQLASLLGVYGLSALVSFVNASLTVALLTAGRQRLVAAALAVGVPLMTGAWGTWRIADDSLRQTGTPLRVGLVQGNIAQTAKWKPGEARRIFTTHIAITRDLARRGAQYVLWPESALPFRFDDDEKGKQAIEDLARELRIHLLFGSDELVGGNSYNSAFLLGPDGGKLAVYRKIHLVPFGEFIPFSGWLAFFPPLVETIGGFAPFAPGTDVVMLPVDGRPTSTAICYEVVYPSLIATAVHSGSELLTTITNDAWYGQSSAPYQHFEMAAMRAIEQGRYLARAANTGISGVIDPYGRVLQRSRLFEEAGLVEEVRLLQGRTIYSRIGDVVAYAGAATILLALLVMRRR